MDWSAFSSGIIGVYVTNKNIGMFLELCDNYGFCWAVGIPASAYIPDIPLREPGAVIKTYSGKRLSLFYLSEYLDSQDRLVLVNDFIKEDEAIEEIAGLSLRKILDI